jgi:hypothetical protein
MSRPALKMRMRDAVARSPARRRSPIRRPTVGQSAAARPGRDVVHARAPEPRHAHGERRRRDEADDAGAETHRSGEVPHSATSSLYRRGEDANANWRRPLVARAARGEYESARAACSSGDRATWPRACARPPRRRRRGRPPRTLDIADARRDRAVGRRGRTSRRERRRRQPRGRREADRDAARGVNADAVGSLARAAAAAAGAFFATAAPTTSSTPRARRRTPRTRPQPLGAYARSKRRANALRRRTRRATRSRVAGSMRRAARAARAAASSTRVLAQAAPAGAPRRRRQVTRADVGARRAPAARATACPAGSRGTRPPASTT